MYQFKFNCDVYSLLDNICIYCLSESNNLTSVNIIDEENVNIIELTKILIGVDFTSMDHYPPLICINCLKKLTACFEFRQQCLASLAKLEVKREQIVDYLEKPSENVEGSKLVSNNEMYKWKVEEVNVGDLLAENNLEDIKLETPDFIDDIIEIKDDSDDDIIKNEVVFNTDEVEYSQQRTKPINKTQHFVRLKGRCGICSICGMKKNNIYQHMKTHMSTKEKETDPINIVPAETITANKVIHKQPKMIQMRGRSDTCPICACKTTDIDEHIQMHTRDKQNRFDEKNEIRIDQNGNSFIETSVEQADPIEKDFEMDEILRIYNNYTRCSVCDSVTRNINQHTDSHINQKMSIKAAEKKVQNIKKLPVNINFVECQPAEKDAETVNRYRRCSICDCMTDNIIEHMKLHTILKNDENEFEIVDIEESQPVGNIDDAVAELLRLKGSYEKCPICECETTNITKHMKFHVNQKKIFNADKVNEIPEEMRHRDKSVQCDICGRIISYAKNMKQHMLTHLNQDKKKTRNRIRNNLVHCEEMEIVHKPIEIVDEKKMCCICGEWTTMNLLRHMYHAHRIDKCNLLNDIKSAVEAGQMFPVAATCQLCDKTCDNILQHTHTFHLEPLARYGGPTEICYICGISVRCLKNHMFIHTCGAVTCDLCKKTFTNLRGLKAHMKIHLNIRNYKCSICSATFIEYSSWKFHENTHYGIRKYRCNICTLRYATSSHLREHIRVKHMGGYNVQCDVCEKVFSSRKNLQKHKKIHTGQTIKRTYPCKFCPKILGSQPGYYLHLRLHTKENPYTCNICDEKFIRVGDYNSHMRQHRYNLI